MSSDGSYQETCEYPYAAGKKGPYQLCLLDSKRYKTAQINAIREIIKISSSLSEIGGVLSCLANLGDPTSILMVPLLDMFEEITLIDTILPLNIELILSQGGAKREYRFSSAKVWDSFKNSRRVVGIVCIICFLLTGIKRIIKLSNGSLLFHLQERAFMPVVIGLSGKAVLYLAVTDEFKGFEWKEIFQNLKVLISFTVILVTIFVIYKIIFLKNQDQGPQANERWRFLFEIYKPDRFYQKVFVLVFIARVTFVSIIIGSLNESPQIQAMLIVFVNFGMLTYLVLSSPIKKEMSFLQHLVIETALLFYNGIFALLVICGLRDEDVKNASGQLVMILSLLTSLITALLILLKL